MSSQTFSANQLFVIASQSRWSPYSADLDTIFTDREAADAELAKSKERWEKSSFSASTDFSYFVESLDEAIRSLRDRARDEGIDSERGIDGRW